LLGCGKGGSLLKEDYVSEMVSFCTVAEAFIFNNSLTEEGAEKRKERELLLMYFVNEILLLLIL